ncbi:MAG: sulfite exporter TauE/SafE family protein [Myxococcota bacterium]
MLRAVEDPFALAAIVVAGLIAGFVNTVAGGGSLLTLPALMLAGLPADVANGTNRVGVLLQTLSALGGFRRAGRLPLGLLPQLALPTVLGGALGAWLAADVLPRTLVEPALLVALATVAVVTLVAPPIESGGESALALREKPAAMVGLFLAGLYGGFVQAGVGFVLLAVLGRGLRMDLVRANALKVALVFLFGLVALGIFLAKGQVHWPPALLLAGATVIGAQLGVRFAVEVPARTLKRLVVLAALASCAAVALRP